MKRVAGMAVLLCVLVWAGCEYEVPLTTDHAIAIDPFVLGLWEAVDDNGQPGKDDARMLVLKYSDTEYLVHHPSSGADTIYYRAYPIKVGEVSCVQLQAIGTNKGPLNPGDKPFHVVTCRRDGDDLTIATLNTDLVNSSITNSAALREAFLANQGRQDLFHKPGKFRRVGNPPKPALLP